MTLLFIIIGSAAFAGIACRFASRLARRHASPFPIK
jgi:hypothetical protein